MPQDSQRTPANRNNQPEQPSRFSTPKGRRKMIMWIAIPIVVFVVWFIYIINAFNW